MFLLAHPSPKLRNSLHPRLNFVVLCTKMASVRALIGLAFFAAIGVLLLLLGCALYNNWYPMFILIFYSLSPIPCLLARQFTDDIDPDDSPLWDFCIFLTTGIVVSAFGLPGVFAHQGVIGPPSCVLIICGNIIVFFTILTYFMLFTGEDQFSFATWI